MAGRPGRWGPARRRATLLGSVLGIAALLVGLVAAGPARAAEFINDSDPTIRRLQEVNDDVYLFGDEATIGGRAGRDAVVASRTFVLDGDVGGNLMVASEDVAINGRVERSARVAARTIRVRGTIRGDLVAAGADIVIEPGARVGGDVVTAGNVEVRGAVGGDVRAQGGEILIDARLGGDARLQSDDITVGPTAQIAGNLSYESNEAAAIDPAARITGTTERREADGPLGLDTGGTSLFSGLVGQFLRLLTALVAGLVVVLLVPRGAVAVAEGARRRPLPSLLIGLAVLVFLPIVLLLLLVTVVGIPIALVGLAVFLVALYLSQVFVGLAIGRLILPRSWADGGRGFNLLAMAMGVLLLGALRFVPVPFFGTGVAVLTAVLGLGAVVVGSRRARSVPATPPPAPPTYAQYRPTAY